MQAIQAVLLGLFANHKKIYQGCFDCHQQGEGRGWWVRFLFSSRHLFPRGWAAKMADNCVTCPHALSLTPSMCGHKKTIGQTIYNRKWVANNCFFGSEQNQLVTFSFFKSSVMWRVWSKHKSWERGIRYPKSYVKSDKALFRNYKSVSVSFNDCKNFVKNQILKSGTEIPMLDSECWCPDVWSPDLVFRFWSPDFGVQTLESGFWCPDVRV